MLDRQFFIQFPIFFTYKNQQTQQYKQKKKARMPNKTQISQAPTNYTQKNNEGGASSFLINIKRQIIQEVKQSQYPNFNKKQLIEQQNRKFMPKNVLVLQPKHLRSITWPEVFMPDQQTYVTLKGNFYVIKDSRNKQKFIDRKSKPQSQIIYFNVDKNGFKLIISSIQKVILKNTKQEQEIWYHFHIAILNQQTQVIQHIQTFQKGWIQATSQSSGNLNSTQSSGSLNSKKPQIYYLNFKGFQLIDNYKKAFVVFQPLGKQKNPFQIFMIDFTRTEVQKDSQKTRIMKYNKTVARASLQKKQSQKFIKIINSEYGDIVLLVTSDQIYEIQIAGQFKPNDYSLIFKPFNLFKMFIQNKNTYIQNKVNQLILSKNIFKKQQTLKDAQYVMNGLKVMILTTHGRIFVVQSQQCIFSQSLYEVLSSKQMVQKYNIQHFIFQNIYFLRGMLIIQVESQKKTDSNLVKKIKYQNSILQKLDEEIKIQLISRAFLIAKVQSNSLSFSKFIELPFGLMDFQYFKIHPYKQSDQILIQTISNKDLQSLQLHKCQILSSKNSFIPFAIEHFIHIKKINLKDTSLQRAKDSQKKNSLKICFGKSTKTFYSLKGNEISGYRIFDNQLVNTLPKGIKNKLNISFFQKPIKIITNPLTGYVVVLYKQFIKFFINTYSQLKLFYVMNLRNAWDISYSKSGQSMIICLNDNSIYMLDSYTFNQTKIMEFYGDVKQASYASEYILYIKSAKNVLNIYKKNQFPQVQINPISRTETLCYYNKLYDVKIQSDDIYYVDQNYAIVIKRDGSLQFYSHIPQDRTQKNTLDQKQSIRLSLLSNQHPHLINRKKILLQKQEHCTYLFYSSQFSTLFIGTNYGKIIQYLYPFLSIQDPSPPLGYKFLASNTSIVHIQLNANFSTIYAVDEMGQFMQFELNQYLNGIRKNAIYTLSKTQVSQTQLKYQFANRNYLMDDYTAIEQKVKTSLKQQYDEVSFIDDKIKDDIEDITNKIRDQSSKQIEILSEQKKKMELQFKCQFNQISLKLKNKQDKICQELDEVQETNNKDREKQVQKYQKQLLEIYKENDRLVAIKNNLLKQYQQEISSMNSRFQAVLNQQINIRETDTQKLISNYEQLKNKYELYKTQTHGQTVMHKIELDLFKKIQQDKVNQELEEEQLKKQNELSKMGKIQKQIQKYKKRCIYFETLIVQTENQIEQLNHDLVLYKQKKQQLEKQLTDKQSLIQQKQKQIVKFLKNTNEMKKVKNVHEFQLEQYESDIVPVQSRIKQLQKKVQKMNLEIMEQFESKVTQNSVIQNSKKRIFKLKNKSKQIKNTLLNSRSHFLRFNEALNSLLSDPFSLKLKDKLRKILQKFSSQNQTFVVNQQLQKAKKESENLVRKKNMLRKAIQQEQKQQQCILRNKNQFFRYYVDNTNVVKQYNDLFRDHNQLLQEKKVLQQKIASLKLDKLNTPMKRTKSMNIRKISQKKLTPFQRYQQQQFQFGTLKIKDTTETRASHGEDSKSFLKSLIKDVNGASNNIQKAGLVRDRIRTFVNPEMQRKRQIQKQLFQRQRGKSNHLMLKL